MAEFDWQSARPVENKTQVSEGRRVLEQAVEGPLREAVSALPFAQAATGFAPLFGLPTGYDITQEQALEAARKQLGLSGQEPSTMLGRAAGAGLRIGTSPSTYYTAPLFGMTSPVATALSAIPGAAAAQVGEETLGLPGAIGFGLLASAPGQLYQTARNVGGGAAREAIGAGASLAEAVGGKKAANVAKTAFESDPMLGANLLRAREIEQITGVSLPTNAAAQGSNVLLQEIRSQAAQNPEFLALLSQQESDAAQAIASRANKMFGPASAERLLEVTKQPASAVKSLNRRIDDIDTQLATLGNRVQSVDETALGTQITNLVKAKEEIARKSVAPLYENALNSAEEAGVKLSGDQTKRIFDFVNSEVNADVFKTFPSIYGKVLANFRPKQTKSTGIIDEVDGVPIFGETTESIGKEASVRELDSLKREINLALRKDVGADTRRVLNNLKNEIGTVIDELPAEFSTAYRNADAQYLKKVGIPFEAKAIEDIGGKGFVEQTVPVLTKNRSALQQFLDIAGDDAKNIVRDSFMYDLSKVSNIVDANGAINAKALDKFIKQNENTLKLAPEVADELRGLRDNTQALVATRNRVANMLKTEQKTEADALFNRISNRGLDATLSDFIVRPAEQQNILKQLQGNPEALKGFRAAMLERMTSTNNALGFLTDNKQAMENLFGKTYYRNVEALAEASQRLAQNPVKLNVPLRTIERTQIEQATGMRPEEIVSLYRRPIVSPFQKVTIAMSKFFQNRASQAENEAIQEFLADPKLIQTAADIYKDIDVSVNPQKIQGLINKLQGEVARRGAFGTAIALDDRIGAEPAQSTPIQQLDIEF